MKLGIEGKVAFVTGGAQGIGREITKSLLAEGCKVVATSRNREALAQIETLGAVGVESDLSEGELLRTIIACDILVNNAGSTLDVTDPYCSLYDWNRVLWLNFLLPVKLSNMVLPAMKARGWGRIVNMSSCSGVENRGPITYGAAKAALTAYTRGMGRILAGEAPGIVMTAILPGLILTEGGHWERVLKERPEHAEKYLREQSPIDRFGKPEEIAPMVAFCCSEHASFMHGAIVPVDAGLSKGYAVQNTL